MPLILWACSCCFSASPFLHWQLQVDLRIILRIAQQSDQFKLYGGHHNACFPIKCLKMTNAYDQHPMAFLSRWMLCAKGWSIADRNLCCHGACMPHIRATVGLSLLEQMLLICVKVVLLCHCLLLVYISKSCAQPMLILSWSIIILHHD